jgi:hypothetical protein
MKRGKGKRARKKYLRYKEKQLNSALLAFREGYNADIPQEDDDPLSTPEKEQQFKLLLRLRWLIYSFLYERLENHSSWRNKQRFLELFDVETIIITNDLLVLKGDIVWWAKRGEAADIWWPSDHQAHPTSIYKVKIRGDLEGGHWILEPLTVRLRLARSEKKAASYYIEFGYGSTYLKITSRNWQDQSEQPHGADQRRQRPRLKQAGHGVDA